MPEWQREPDEIEGLKWRGGGSQEMCSKMGVLMLQEEMGRWKRLVGLVQRRRVGSRRQQALHLPYVGP